MRLARVALVVLTAEGIALPAFDDQPPLALGRDELALLLDLAAGRWSSAAGPGRPHSEVDEFVRALGERGFLTSLESTAAAVSRPATFVRPAPAGAPRWWNDETEFVARVPVLLRPSPQGFEHLDHDGNVVACLDIDEVLLVAAFASPRTPRDARSVFPGGAPEGGEAFDQRLEVIVRSGIVGRFDLEASVQGRAQRQQRAMRDTMIRFNRAMRESLDAHVEAEALLAAAGQPPKTKVLPVLSQPGMTPLALGMLFASARAHAGGALRSSFDFVPHWWLHPEEVGSYAERPAIYLFSNYVWSVRDHLALGARAKAANAANLTVHGGPDTPRNPSDVDRFFADNPEVDIAVHGEGELTTIEMLEALATARGADGSFDLAVLADVPGLSFRDRGRVVRTADRTRVAELDDLPSPYLTGVFDGAFSDGRTSAAIIETNRGCPYGCTFCDWGSATLSRIRKFDLERVFGELEWCARNRVSTVVLADANFGIFERDVAIAKRVAELKEEFGYPFNFGTNYAKNTVKHLKPIVQTLVAADVLTEGLLSLQTMDPGTLSSVKRSNIKTAKYDLLANEFRSAGLPLFVDLMIGLPGSTTSSFRDDLQQCIDREVTPKIFQTEVLVNSPMNQPEYREHHQIVTGHAGDALLSSKVVAAPASNRRLIVSTSSFTRDDYAEMMDLRRMFRLVDNYGVLRQITRFARQETGRREIDVIDQLRRDARKWERWPMLAITVGLVPELMVPPLSWWPFIDEMRAYLIDELGIPDDTSLDAVLRVQHALLPASDRTFPADIELAHDYAEWHRSMLAAKGAGHQSDWHLRVPHLRDLPPARFTVDDPGGVCSLGLGFSNEADWGGDWELASAVARAMPNRHSVYR